MPIQKPVTLEIYSPDALTWNDPKNITPATSPYTQRTCNKGLWPTGPWMTEGDHYSFHHRYPIYLLRNEVGGNWCGYLALPGNHAFYGYHYNLINNFVEVHGGITYTDWNIEGSGPTIAGENTLWIVGFDCAHSSDLAPGLASVVGDSYSKLIAGGTYRNIKYVEDQIKYLAEQLLAYDNQRMLIEVQPNPNPDPPSYYEAHFSFHDWKDSHLWLGKPANGRGVTLVEPTPPSNPTPEFERLKKAFLSKYTFN